MGKIPLSKFEIYFPILILHQNRQCSHWKRTWFYVLVLCWKNTSLQTGADSPELALLTLCDVWMRAGSTAVLHSTAPEPCHVLSVRPGNWRTTFFRNLLGSDSEEHDCSVASWYVWQYDRAHMCKASCHPGCNMKKKLKAHYVQHQPQGVLE